MSEFNITVPGGESKRLKTGGKYCPADIVVTAEGRMPVEEKDVNFYDYDGTLLYSYTLAEAQALTELPPAPTPKKDFLLFQEWNWTLEEIKEVGDGVDVGATYTTVNGNVYMVVELLDEHDLGVIFNFTGKGAIHWGDGTEESITTGSMYEPRSISHEYPTPGVYTINFVGVKGIDYNSVGDPNKNLPPIGSADGAGKGKLVEFYCGAPNYSDGWWNQLRTSYGLRLCSIYSVATAFGSACFYDCTNLEFFVIPRTFVKLNGSNFISARALRKVVLPYGAKTFGLSNFESCHALKELKISDGCTELPYGLRANNYAVQRIIVPATVTSIKNRALTGLLTCRILEFKPLTPPTLEASSSIGVPSWCIVKVPAASLEAYKAATNYGSIAAQMIGV